MQSFLLIGQSNMAGRGFKTEVEPILNEKLWMLRNGAWQMMVEPLNYDAPVAGVGPAASFGDYYVSQNPDSHIGFIPCAAGGSSLEDWAVDGALFKHAVCQAKLAMDCSSLTGILWHQGESDSNHGQYTHYRERLTTIFDALKQELAVSDIPIIIGGLPDFLGKTGYGLSCPEYKAIDAILQEFPNTYPNCYYVSTQDLEANPDGIHINAQSQRRLGLRYCAAFCLKQNITGPLAGETEILNRLAQRMPTSRERMFLVSMDLAFGLISYDEFILRYSTLAKEQSS